MACESIHKERTMNPFSETAIGDVTLPNRLLMAPVKTAYGTLSGQVTSRHLAYYRRRADGGVGSIIVEPLYIDSLGKEHPKQIGITQEIHLDGLRRLASTIHQGGAIAIAHLNHAGRAANPKAIGHLPEAPSETACPTTGATSISMNAGRIRKVIEEYAIAADRAVKTGFDIIEIQFGLGYLVHQFYSAQINHRKDDYGGSTENRLRFGREILETVRDRIGSQVPVIARISASVTGNPGEIDDAIVLAKNLQEWGVNALHVVSGSACDSPPLYYQHMRIPGGKNLEWASEIRKEVSIPVIVAGRMGDPGLINRALKDNLVDGIALGRPLVADPDLPLKMKQGKSDRIIQCGACLQGCLVKVKSGVGLSCIVNPEVGREEHKMVPATRHLKVVVVGGGPAGMEAALTAERRGHRVTLFEKDELGGQFRQAVLAPGKEMMNRPLTSLIHQLESSNTDLRIGKSVAVEDILEEKPDVVLLATGAKPVIPPVKGLTDVLDSEDVLFRKREVGKRVLVIGGGMVGLETAEFLAVNGHSVIVVELLEEVAADMEPITRKLTLKNLESHEVKILKKTTLSRIEDSHAYVLTEDGEEYLGEFDSIIAATGTTPQADLEHELHHLHVPVQLIGDSNKPGNILEAVRDGYETGARIEEFAGS